MMWRWLILLTLMGWLGWKAWSFVASSRSPLERALALRGVMAFAMIGFLVLIGFVFVPMPFKVLFVIPAFLVSGSVAKAFRDARNRIKEEPPSRVNIDKMKRIN